MMKLFEYWYPGVCVFVVIARKFNRTDCRNREENIFLLNDKKGRLISTLNGK